MSDQLERYAAALLGCGLAATWAAAGASAALIALAAAAACYGATALAQRGSARRLLSAMAHDLAGFGASRAAAQPKRRSPHARTRPRQTPLRATPRRPRPAPARIRDEPLSDHSLAPVGPYGW